MAEQHQPTRTTLLLHQQRLLQAEVAHMLATAQASGEDLALAAACAADVQKPVATWLLGAMSR